MSTYEFTHESTQGSTQGSVHAHSDGNVFTFVLAGDVDISVQDRLDVQLARFSESDATDGLVDLGAVTFLDSTGLSFLARLRQVSESRGGVVCLRRPTQDVRRLLELVGFDTVFDVEPAVVSEGGSAPSGG